MTEFFSISNELQVEAVKRAREQERIYGHNSGFFRLEVEKENTVTGVLGELVAREVLKLSLAATTEQVIVELTDIGSKYDLEIHGVENLIGAHVKTGMWRQWPRLEMPFGIHADQKVQETSVPLILVSLLRPSSGFPNEARVEGYVWPTFLATCRVISRGERFPITNVISRTNNILTFLSDYLPIQNLGNFEF